MHSVDGDGVLQDLSIPMHVMYTCDDVKQLDILDYMLYANGFTWLYEHVDNHGNDLATTVGPQEAIQQVNGWSTKGLVRCWWVVNGIGLPRPPAFGLLASFGTAVVALSAIPYIYIYIYI